MELSPFTPTLKRRQDMTTKDKAARRKLSLLELAKELDNVSRACKELRFPIHPAR